MGSKNPSNGKPQRQSGEHTREESGNEGEGNRTADRNYRKATQEFVKSDRGKRAIQKAGDVPPDEQDEILRAEEEAKGHAKEHDPTEISDRSRPA